MRETRTRPRSSSIFSRSSRGPRRAHPDPGTAMSRSRVHVALGPDSGSRATGPGRTARGDVAWPMGSDLVGIFLPEFDISFKTRGSGFVDHTPPRPRHGIEPGGSSTGSGARASARRPLLASSFVFLFIVAGLFVLPSPASGQSATFTTTADFDAGTKNLPGDGNFGVETRTDSPAVPADQLELASVRGDSFTLSDPDADTFKWDIGLACTVRGPTTIVREISNGVLRLGAQKATGSSRVGVVMSSAISGDLDARVKVVEVATDPSAQFELLVFNEKRCYSGIPPQTADGAFYTWDEGPVDGNFLLKAVMVTDNKETNCGTATTVSLAPVHLRITRSGSTWTWWYSGNGVAWTQDKQCTNPVSGDLYAALIVKDSKGGITTTFHADDFHVAGGAPVPGGYRAAGAWISPTFDVPSGYALDRIEVGGAFDPAHALDRTELRRGGAGPGGVGDDNGLVLVPADTICGGNLNVRLYLKGSGAATPAVTQVDVFHATFTTTLENVLLGTSTGTQNQCASDDLYDTKTEALGAATSEHLVASEFLLTGNRIAGDGPPTPSDTDASDDLSVLYREAAVPAFADTAPRSQTLTPADLDSGAFPGCLASDEGATCAWSEAGSTTTTDHAPATRNVLTGVESGTFPDGVSVSDDVYLEYDEAEGATLTQDYFPSAQTILNGVEGTPPAYRQGRFVRKTDGPGPQSVTGVGFEPRALIIWWTRQTTFWTLSPGNYAGIGLVASSAQQYAIAWGDDDAASPANSGRRSVAAATD